MKDKQKLDFSHIDSAVFFIIVGKINGSIQLQMYSTTDINTESQNKLISNIFRVNRAEEFLAFIEKHPIVINNKDEDGNYLFTTEEYKRLINLLKRQQGFYIDTYIPVSYIPKQININRGNKIQKYSETGELLKTYIGIRDATRLEAISDTNLKSAIKNKTIYAGYRWLYLDRDSDDNTVQEIGESVKVNTPKNAFVAMLDIDKTRIVNVYKNQKDAGLARKLKSSSAIYQSIVKGNLSSGHYFKYYEECSDELKAAFLENGGVLPEAHINKGVAIKQIDYITGELIKEYPSLLDVQKNFQISSKCIKKAIATGEVIKGFRWKY